MEGRSAAAYGDATEEELREAVADMGDDELLGHDIWFVATGASENGNAGIRAFLDAHRSQLRGVFLINPRALARDSSPCWRSRASSASSRATSAS